MKVAISHEFVKVLLILDKDIRFKLCGC